MHLKNYESNDYLAHRCSYASQATAAPQSITTSSATAMAFSRLQCTDCVTPLAAAGATRVRMQTALSPIPAATDSHVPDLVV